jgi:murein DD-endopeptidase MepM/ murein hydrolase activator NlpD
MVPAVACSDDGGQLAAATSASPAATDDAATATTDATVGGADGDSSTTHPSTTTTMPATTTTLPPPVYVFPFVGKRVSYGTTHHDYPAADVFGCGAIIVAPTDGTVVQTRDIDLWDPKVDSPANRGGRFVAMVGRDGVRYYFAHLETVLAVEGQAVQPGDPLGVMGRTGNARKSACHTHVGISWPCPANEWAVRRGEIWPAPYLDAWQRGEQKSPVLEIYATAQASPTACDDAIADPLAADA